MVAANVDLDCRLVGEADLTRPEGVLKVLAAPYAMCQADVGLLLNSLPNRPIFDLVVTSPPYNIGKVYEKRRALADYLDWQMALSTRAA